jgi:hypothetical protein
MIAAVLHLHESAHVAVEAIDQMQRGFADGIEIVDADFFFVAAAEIERALGLDPCAR